jgi:hypothetical protein
MHGNVWEWCQDRYAAGYYASAPAIDPPGPAEGTGHVVRGGDWFHPLGYSRSANRDFTRATRRDLANGFRVVCLVARADPPPRRARRLIYNSDADNMFIYHVPPMAPADVHPYVDEVADAGATTLFMCPNYGMALTLPSVAGERFAGRLTEEEARRVADTAPRQTCSVERGAANMQALLDAGHEPMGVVIDRARERGLEVFVTFRPNEAHCVDTPDAFPLNLLITDYWRQHPQWRIGNVGDPLSPLYEEILGPGVSPVVFAWMPGALNFALPEVRRLRLEEIRECCDRYPIDGLDLDFQRFPIYFLPGEEQQHRDTMTEWVREVRAMTRQIAERRGRPIQLSVRVMARPEQSLGIGLDPARWAREGLIDFVVASHYLKNNFPLPLADYRAVLPDDMPLYGSIEVEPQADTYRVIARQLWRDGADGIMLFNFFTTREGGKEPPFEIIRDLGDPEKLGQGAE